MTIYLAADHAGFELKEDIKKMLTAEGFSVVDKGAHTLETGDDYPKYMHAVAEAVAKDGDSAGILFGGSGEGEAIEANRTAGIRAVVYYGGPEDILILSREHNDANILSLGARFLSRERAREAVMLWLDTKFSGDMRHTRRNKQIDKL